MTELSRLLSEASRLLGQGRYAELAARAWRRLRYVFPISPPALEPVAPLAAWLAQNAWTERARLDLVGRIERLSTQPRILVVVDATQVTGPGIGRTLASLRQQAYPRWEVACVVHPPTGDTSADHTLAPSSDEALVGGVRVVARQPEEPLGRVLARAVDEVRCEILVLIWAGDALHNSALGEIALEFVRNPDTDLVYCDDDTIDGNGRHGPARFKSAWSPERALWPDTVGEMIALSQQLFSHAGGFDAGTGEDAYEVLKLRAIARARRCVGIHSILHHRGPHAQRQHRAHPASQINATRHLRDAAAWACRETADAALRIEVKPSTQPAIAVVLWGIKHPNGLDEVISRLCKLTVRTTEIHVVGRPPQGPRTASQDLSVSFRPEASVAAALNAVARECDTPFVLLLHAEAQLPGEEWLSLLVGALALPGAEVAGAFRMDSEGRAYGWRPHARRDTRAGTQPPMEWCDDLSSAATPCLLVSAHCLLTRRKTLLDLGGLDAEAFATGLADADYCAKANAAGLRVVHLPLDGALPPSPGEQADPSALLALRCKHRTLRDPWLNPSLDNRGGRTVLVPRRVLRSSPATFDALFFSHALSMEGAPFSQYELARQMKRAGVLRPQVAAPADGALSQLYRRDGIQVHIDPRLRPQNWTRGSTDLAVQAASSLIASTSAALVHANTLVTFPAVEAAFRVSCPSVWNPRESEPWDRFFRFLDLGQVRRALACFRYPYRVVFVAQATAQVWSQFDTQHNFMVIRNGLDPSRLASEWQSTPKADARRAVGVGEGEVAVVSIGTVCARKGQRDLPAALAKLPTTLAPTLKLFVVGDEPGAYSACLHDDIRRLPDAWRSRIVVVPTRPDVGLYYRAADLFLLSSRAESYPRVLLEAMAFQLPILATPVFGVREQVVEGVNAVFYAPGDCAALALRLRALAEDRGRLQALAAGSGPVLRSLQTFEEMAEQYSAVFREAFYTGQSPVP